MRNAASIPVHRVIIPISIPPPLPIATATAALGLAAAATSGGCCPTTTSALTRLAPTASFVVAFRYWRAHKGVVNRDGLVKKFGSVQ